MKIKELYEGMLGSIGRGLAQATVPQSYAANQERKIAANKDAELAQKLDPKYQAAMDQAQKLAMAKAAEKQKASVGRMSATSWDPNRSILTIGADQYQKTKTGWKNWYNKNLVTDPTLISKIDYQFDLAVGNIKPSAKTSTPTVTTNTGVKVWKDLQGRWYRLDTNKRVTDPVEIQQLNQILQNKKQLAKARG